VFRRRYLIYLYEKVKLICIVVYFLFYLNSNKKKLLMKYKK
jgi:hypothetical protein